MRKNKRESQKIPKIDREIEIQRIVKHLENMITLKKVSGNSTFRSGFDSLNTGNESRRVERDQVHERIVRRID